MFLLIPYLTYKYYSQLFRLHSIMFLLIQQYLALGRHEDMFTFHYVSINTRTVYKVSRKMLQFTFHYVSINTSISIMSSNVASMFTFHYVSINTLFFLFSYFGVRTFTFHYVSINTMDYLGIDYADESLHSIMFLLILMCS